LLFAYQLRVQIRAAGPCPADLGVLRKLGLDVDAMIGTDD